MPYWDERVEEMAKNYPDVKWDKYHIDILTAQFVLKPDRFDVVVASNLFGDILSDLGPACTGTIGIAPSGNINPERKFPSLFEPVHGSAPDIAGQGIANPIGQIWSGAMMLEHLGEPEAAGRDRHGDRDGAGRAEAPHPRPRRPRQHRRLRQGGRRSAVVIARMSPRRGGRRPSCPSLIIPAGLRNRCRRRLFFKLRMSDSAQPWKTPGVQR